VARPRSETAHRAALDATVELLLEQGIEGVTFEEVAARSGVARTTLYRHFGSRDALVAKAARCCVIEHPTPDTGSLEGDLRFLFDRYQDAEDSNRVPDLLPMLIDLAGRDPEMRVLVDDVLAQRRRPMRTVIQLAQLRGEVAADLDMEVALALVIGPFSYRRMVDRRDVTPEFAETVLRASVAALRSTASAPEPVA
jgi:AcrR family transcriptional regulator